MSEGPVLPRQLGREDFTAERARLYAEMLRRHGLPEPMSDEARENSRRAVLSTLVPGQDLWLFAYGSLMWNPALKVAESRRAQISGYGRHFCLTVSMGRGTPENPGLMLALDREPGAICSGIAHRVLNEDLDSETRILWYREMISGAYRPHWLDGEFVESSGKARLLAFVVRRDHARYEPQVSHPELVRRIAQAEGIFGSNRDYLYRTAEFIAERGLAEDRLVELAQEVRAFRIQQGEPS